MQVTKVSSAAMAAAAAMLFSSGFATVSVAADAATIHCSGVNSCKGTSVQVREEQLQGNEQLQGPGLDVHVQGRLQRRESESRGRRQVDCAL